MLEQVRQRYDFVVVGYVVMPDHIHLRIAEPEKGNPSKVMQAIKQGFARRVLKSIRRRRYMHENPVRRGFVQEPDQWPWSSCRSYALGEPGTVKINQWGEAKMKIQGRAA